jgi:hypothetical protein
VAKPKFQIGEEVMFLCERPPGVPEVDCKGKVGTILDLHPRTDGARVYDVVADWGVERLRGIALGFFDYQLTEATPPVSDDEMAAAAAKLQALVAEME